MIPKNLLGETVRTSKISVRICIPAMSDNLPVTVKRVQDFLSNKDSQAKVKLLPTPTATAEEAACALSVAVGQIGKSIVFGGRTRVVVVVVSGDQKVDAVKVALAVGEDTVEVMRAANVKNSTGFVIGGVSPFALPDDVDVVIDLDFYERSYCFVAAGHPRAIVLTNGRELVALTGAVVAQVADSGRRSDDVRVKMRMTPDELDDAGALCI